MFGEIAPRMAGANTFAANIWQGPQTFNAATTFNGAVTLNSPGTAPTLLVKSLDGANGIVMDVQSAVTGGFVSFRNSGTEKGFFGTGPATLSGAALGDFTIGSEGVLRMTGGGSITTSVLSISSTGAIFTGPASAGTALTVNGFGANNFVLTVSAGSASMANAIMFLSGGASSTGVETIRMDKCATTGTGTATFTATNKPTATAGGPVTWIPINLDGTRRYIPVWA